MGPSNMMMSGDGAEASGILLRLSEIVVGPLTLKSVGALGAGRGRGLTPNLGLFDWYSAKNAVPVMGWIGGNVLKNFRLTIDYPRRIVYWQKQTDPDTNDLDQVGLTLQSQHHEYIVSAVATKTERQPSSEFRREISSFEWASWKPPTQSPARYSERCMASPRRHAC